MKETFKFGFILGFICIIAAGLLAWIDILTKPKILAQEKLEEKLSLKAVFPLADRFEEVREGGEIDYYKAFDAKGELLGYAFKATERGYSGEVKTIAGMRKDGEIAAIKVLFHNETPGLGSRIAADDFTNRFKGISDLSKVEAITGATISSKTVIDSVKNRAEEVKLKVGDER
jgi:Na+-translocating ferredoxin:NAD+ oxidoreductase subunit G